LPVEIWFEYAKAMIVGYSIRKCAIVAGVSVKTSFYMIHKILDAIRLHQGVGSVEGVVEMDETFFAESFKGNHKKDKAFTMPRKPRKRGKEIKKRN